MERKRVTTTLPPDLFQAIKLQAVKENRPLSDLLEELVKKYLSEKSEGVISV